MYDFTRTDIDLQRIRERIRRMDDEALERYGRAAAAMVERSERETWRVQLREAREEWRRRHPNEPGIEPTP